MDSSSNASSTNPGVESGADDGGVLTRFASSSWRAACVGIDHALDLVFPPTCVSCHGLVERDASGFRHLCVSCRRRVVLVREPHCATCGYPFFGEKAENSACLHCELLRPVYGEGRTATLLQGPTRRLVHALKYEKGFHILRDIEAIARANRYFTSFLAGAVLVPVPLHARKERERGYNQAELLAKCLAGVAGSAGVERIVHRVVDTSTQTRLNRESRQENLKNAFALADARSLKATLRYVLVDDVFTTGATLNACARVLRRSGLTRVDVATLGHG